MLSSSVYGGIGTTPHSSSGRSFGYGLLLVPTTTLGGVWIAAVGLPVVVGLAAIPAVAFVVINGFGGVEFGESTQ